VPERWKQIALNTIAHRSDLERAAMARAFCGVTTSQRVCEDFGLPPDTLP
jgi:hypothetical protein